MRTSGRVPDPLNGESTAALYSKELLWYTGIISMSSPCQQSGNLVDRIACPGPVQRVDVQTHKSKSVTPPNKGQMADMEDEKAEQDADVSVIANFSFEVHGLAQLGVGLDDAIKVEFLGIATNKLGPMRPSMLESFITKATIVGVYFWVVVTATRAEAPGRNNSYGMDGQQEE
ncbi:hypothetical protein NDA11_007684 [Ustilago hordei]|uniref:Uncharacterized protein n=1 Tax=Ustilago hordei TaxID=120017 RepID=I2FP49_USTHO|nr:hypothetical protein NDA12_005853 [Ustilago hordei]KAJ1574528.1 hypothetical protein NDA15_004719 [Ustilago hordei]KAJ1580474.1 hypothetical protein NDA11_007684 [Ustilago hordei]KAJ1599406.1 hypothetical protein NDA14_001030 [Ustilago hordei]CCF48692.1 uncharacterized protein UHOR_06591 [Ustilago hordei]